MGMQILVDVVERFGAAEDPDMEGHKLLELYQAQLVSAIRMALGRDAGPITHGCRLAAVFLEAGLHGVDPVVVRRLMAMLLKPLKDWDKLQGKGSADERYAEWVGVRLRAALLSAHARCAALAAAAATSPAGAISAPAEDVREAIRAAQAPYKEQLERLWLALLQENIVLSTQPLHALSAYRPTLFSSTNPPVTAAVRPHLAAAWPAAMRGLTATMTRDTLTAAASTAASTQAGSSPRQAEVVLWACLFGLQEAAGDVRGSHPVSFGADIAPSLKLQTALECLRKLVSLHCSKQPLWRSPDKPLALAALIQHLALDVIQPKMLSALWAPALSERALGGVPLCLSCCAEILSGLARTTAALEGCDPTQLSELRRAILDSSLALACLCIPLHQAKLPGTSEAHLQGISEEEERILAASMDTSLGAAEAVLQLGAANAEEEDEDGCALLEAAVQGGLLMLPAAPAGPKLERTQRFLVASLGHGLTEAAPTGHHAVALAATESLCSDLEAHMAATPPPALAGSLLAVLVEVAAQLPGASVGTDSGSGGQLQLRVLSLMGAALKDGSPPWLRQASANSLQATLQAAADCPAGSKEAAWALSCFVSTCGIAVSQVIGRLEHGEPSQPSEDPPAGGGEGGWAFQGATPQAGMGEEEVQFAGSTVRTVMLALRVSEAAQKPDQEASAAVMGLLVPLLLACAAPRIPCSASPALSAMALKLITHLAQGGSSSSDSFKACVAALPIDYKQRLQKALQATQQEQRAAAAAAASFRPVAQQSSIKPPKIAFNLSKFS